MKYRNTKVKKREYREEVLSDLTLCIKKRKIPDKVYYESVFILKYLESEGGDLSEIEKFRLRLSSIDEQWLVHNYRFSRKVRMSDILVLFLGVLCIAELYYRPYSLLNLSWKVEGVLDILIPAFICTFMILVVIPKTIRLFLTIKNLGSKDSLSADYYSIPDAMERVWVSLLDMGYSEKEKYLSTLRKEEKNSIGFYKVCAEAEVKAMKG